MALGESAVGETPLGGEGGLRLQLGVAETDSTAPETTAEPGATSAGLATAQTESAAPETTADPGTVTTDLDTAQTETQAFALAADPGAVSATLGTAQTESAGQPLTVGFDIWTIDGEAVTTHVSDERTWQTLAVTFNTDGATITDVVEPLRSLVGQFETVPLADGSYRTRENAPSATVTVTPPIGQSPPREGGTFAVEDVAVRALDQRVADGAAELAFRALSNREPDGTATDETRAAAEWSFAFRAATIATKRVQHDVERAGDTGVETVDFAIICDPAQAKIVEESATRLAAVSTREVPDGPNRTDDDAPNDENTIAITTPDGEDPIPEGDYAVRDWTSEWLNDAAYRVRLTVAPV